MVVLSCRNDTEKNGHPYISTLISTALCILLYSGLSTYVGLYGSGLFNLGPPNLVHIILGFDVPTSSSIFIEMFLYIHVLYGFLISEWITKPLLTQTYLIHDIIYMHL